MKGIKSGSYDNSNDGGSNARVKDTPGQRSAPQKSKNEVKYPSSKATTSVTGGKKK